MVAIEFHPQVVDHIQSNSLIPRWYDGEERLGGDTEVYPNYAQLRTETVCDEMTAYLQSRHLAVVVAPKTQFTCLVIPQRISDEFSEAEVQKIINLLRSRDCQNIKRDADWNQFISFSPPN